MNISRTGPLLQWVIVIASAVLVGWLFNEFGSHKTTILFGAVVVSFIVLKANEKVLPVLLILALALGSLYLYQVARQSFYLRFFLLGLIALRGVFLFMEAKRKGLSVIGHRNTPLHWAVFIVGGFGLLTSPFSVDPGVSAQRAFSFMLLGFVVFVYFWLRTESAVECKGYVVALRRSAIIILGVGFLLLLTGAPGLFKSGRLRLILMNPNTLGHYCALVTPILIWHLQESVLKRDRIVSWALILASITALVWSGSRGALVSVIIALSFQFALCYRKQLFAVLLLGILAVSVHALMGESVPHPGEDPSFLEETVIRAETLGSGSGRRAVWEVAWGLVDRRPFFGHGFGSVESLFRLGYFPRLQEFQGGHIHNSYLEELVNLGWVGASPIFAAILFLLLVGGSKLIKTATVSPNYRLACALYGVLIAGAFSGAVESWFTSVGSVFCFPFWFVAMLFIKLTTHFNDWKAVSS